MIRIEQETLCKYCQDTFEVDPSRCEGNGCDRAHAQYVEEHGINIEQKCFNDLSVGDILYRIVDGNIKKSKVKKVLVNHEGFSILVDTSIDWHTVERMACKGKNLYIHKEDVIKAYSEHISKETMRMTKHLFNFMKE